MDEFKSITKFRIFNTNNLWIKLSAIKRILTAGTMHMEIIENKKSINGTAVIQLEQVRCHLDIDNFLLPLASCFYVSLVNTCRSCLY